MYDVIILVPIYSCGYWRKIVELALGQIVSTLCGAGLRAQDFLISNCVLRFQCDLPLATYPSNTL